MVQIVNQALNLGGAVLGVLYRLQIRLETFGEGAHQLITVSVLRLLSASRPLGFELGPVDLALGRLLHQVLDVLVDDLSDLLLAQNSVLERSCTIRWLRSGAKALARLILQGKAIHLRLRHIHAFVVWADYHSEERSTHGRELGLLHFVRPKVEVTWVDFEVRMTVIPGQFCHTIAVDLLIDAHLLGITDLTVAKPLGRLMNTALRWVNFADYKNTHLVRSDGKGQLSLIDLAGENADDLVL